MEIGGKKQHMEEGGGGVFCFPPYSSEQLAAFLGHLGDSEHALSSGVFGYINSPLSFTFWS